MANSSTSSNKLSRQVVIFGFITVLLLCSCQAKPHRGMNQADYKKAMEHYTSMQRHGCSKPKPRTIRVQDVHNEPDKKFLPSYVLLHRCDSQSGCCDNASQVCSPLTTEPVTLYFLVEQTLPLELEEGNSAKIRRRHHKQNVVVDHREFINHTACHCKNI